MPSLFATLIVALVAASSTTAQSNHLAAMPGALDPRQALVPRQTASRAAPVVPTECWNAVISLFSSLPTLPPDVESAVEAQLARDPKADLCSFTTPTSLAAQFSSYSAQVDAWSLRNANQLTACSDLPDINAFSACGSGRSATQPTNPAVTSSTRSGNAPARQTGMAAAAVAAVGLAAAIL